MDRSFAANAGKAALFLGRTQTALDLLEQGESEGKKVRHTLMLSYARTSLARGLLRAGRVEEAASTAESALRFPKALDLGPYLQGALEISAETLAHFNPEGESRVDEMMEQAAAMVARGHSPWNKIEHLMTRARIGIKLGRLERTRQDLAEARVIYQEMGVENGTGELWVIEKALEEVEIERRQ